MAKVTVFGTGYVGLVTGACLADIGNHVVCVDIDAQKIANLQQGIIPIYEPGLDDLIITNRDARRLQFTTDAAAAVAHGDYLFIAVGTPPDEDGSADLRHVLAVAETIGRHLDRSAIVVNKSTVPVGTGDRTRDVIHTELTTRGYSFTVPVVSNPEFLKEGSAVKDCTRPDRIVLGTESPEAAQAMRQLYAPFNRHHDRIVVMSVRSAELTKYAANAMLATKISCINEIANIAERVGADIEMVRQGIGHDPRIGWDFIYAGAGYGGSCFPKDIQALTRISSQAGYETRILRAVEAVNHDQKRKLFHLIHTHFNGDLSGKVFALWGLAFKPNTDDIRESPSRTLMEQLWAAGASVQAYDPRAMSETHRVYGRRSDLALCLDPYATLENADALVVVTEWKEFWSPDFARIRETLRHPAVFDGRNIYDSAVVESAGITHYAIGRSGSSPHEAVTSVFA